MKLHRAILLVFSLFAISGEAANAWSGNGLMLYRRDRHVTYDINVTGLGDTAANFYLVTLGEEGLDEYEYALRNLRTPKYVENSAIANGKASFEHYIFDFNLEEINNFYYEIFIDSEHFMLGRFGESPDFSVTLTLYDADSDTYYYAVNTTVKFKDGYIAPYHEGPDPNPTPEPTSGLLLLIGSAALLLRRTRSATEFRIGFARQELSA